MIFCLYITFGTVGFSKGLVAHAIPIQPAPSVYDLVEAVNELREEFGLNQLNSHPILMQIAQSHADYMASVGGSTHYSADGKRPFQRALDAGYPVAGDLSLGGFFSENIMGGPNLTPQEVIQIWMGDEPHQNTMLSPNRSDIGAGISTSGNFVYYVLDTGLMSQSRVSYTPSVGDQFDDPPVVMMPLATNTPKPDGSIVHTIRSGETLWTIAIAYGLKVDHIANLNQLNPNHFIYPGDQLTVRQPAPPSPTVTATLQPASTQRIPLTATSTPLLVSNQASSQPPEESIHPLAITAFLIAAVTLGIVLWQGRSHDSKDPAP